MKKRTKRYRPKIAPSLPICFALPKAAMLDLDLMPHLCVEAFIDGSAVEQNIYTLANVANMAGLLAEINHPESLPIAIAGQNAIVRVIERFTDTGKLGFSGDDYQQIKAAVTLNDELQAISTRRTLRDVIVHLRDMA